MPPNSLRRAAVCRSSYALVRAQRLASVLVCAACTSEFPLGAWGTAGHEGDSNGGTTSRGGTGAGESGEAGGGPLRGGASGSNGCQLSGTVLPANAPGADVDVTTTSTDFAWPSAFDSTEIELVVETEHDRDGYFWAYQFSLAGSPASGFVGLQVNGGYQAVPPNGEVAVTTMAVFWIGGAPLKAELGDVAFPDARTYLKVDNAATTPNPNTWWTIHAKYPVVRCRPYRMRVARVAQEANGDIWYGATIRDVQASVDTYFGRILVPAAWGQIRSTSAFMDRIGWGTPTSCSYPEYASGRFSFPTASDGNLLPLSHSNRFESPAHCGTSRFTELVGGVRHELGVR
ncbi:MAG TPA: hypothetical protein VFQ35_11915 [Polyangiaceae bacterium]|nr:hypothetical protein [Polyangiaceae bacterium]